MSTKKVLITGGTGSVGQGMVKEFSQSGFEVTFQYYTQEQVAHGLARQCGARTWKANFLDSFEVPEVPFDVVINNAGVNLSAEIAHKVDLQVWHDTININLTTAFRICKQVLPSMVDSGWGRIINISSIYGLRGVDWTLPYVVSKHGMSGLTKSIAKDYAKYGVTCNEICPGPIVSEMMKRVAEQEAPHAGLSADEFLHNYAQQIPAKRLAEPVDVVRLALFLASDNAGYINGVSIPVDGAWIA